MATVTWSPELRQAVKQAKAQQTNGLATGELILSRQENKHLVKVMSSERNQNVTPLSFWQ